ncbi:SMC-Scp complex subunit ScpB [Paenibacillus pectinilyticus]|uniref:Segregation and condensation protein B n=2 Tax=Paenibacillus pectinilyticus TaxID=512399 RepID=A0A1C0ZWI9_9BACL|nr:SMC-Scp complex subunit ScpB [Paenibacillus pectinilyticus]
MISSFKPKRRELTLTLNFQQMKSIIEGLLFASGDEGLDIKQIAEVMELDAYVIKDLLKDMRTDFKRKGRGVQIVEVAGSYQLTTLAEHAPYFERLAYSPSRSSLSQAALETLSIVAYKQPITRVEIEEIRGVKCDRALATLTSKDLITEVGRADAVGRPILYGTSKQFLEYFGLSSIQELPDSANFQGNFDLEEETRMLFDRLGGDQKQLTLEDVSDEHGE